MIYEKIKRCRISKKIDLVSVGKFKKMTLTGTFPANKIQKIPHLPFEVVYSKSSKLLQLNHNYSSKLLYGDNYGYRSGLNPTMVEHLKSKSKFLKKKINFNKNFILDIGANDGTFLSFFKGKNIYAMDPTLKKLKKYYKGNIKKLPFVFESGFKFVKKKNLS